MCHPLEHVTPRATLRGRHVVRRAAGGVTWCDVVGHGVSWWDMLRGCSGDEYVRVWSFSALGLSDEDAAEV
jgi:hypothetical protein